MRSVVWVVATLVAGCNDSGDDYYCGNGVLDLGEECDSTSEDVCSDCKLRLVDMTARWSFETLAGDVKAPCLPGDPDVEVGVQGGYTQRFSKSAPCADGQLTLRAKSESLFICAMSGGYMAGSRLVTPSPSGELPTIVIYTDAGHVLLSWATQDAMGMDRSCSGIGVVTVRLLIDGTPVPDGEAECGDSSLTAGPILAGLRSVRVEGLDFARNVVAASSPNDVPVSAGAEVNFPVILRALP